MFLRAPRTNQAQDRHLARGPVDEVLSCRCQVQVLAVVSLLAGVYGVRMNLQLVCSVFELVGLADRLPWQLPGFSNRHKPRIELDCDGSAGDETARLDFRDKVWRPIAPSLRHEVDHFPEELFAGQQRRDVAKGDPRLRVSGNVADVLLQLLGRGHTTDRKYSRVPLNPSSRPTFGSQLRRLRARVMSGRRCLGSSTGRSRNTILLSDPARRTIVCA